jgi:hypothetical protein
VGDEPATLCWAAKPEEGLRGLYRSGGISFGAPSYQMSADRTEIRSLPVRTWSSATVTAGWERRNQASSLVESSLRDDGTGRLRGIVTQRFGEPLADWTIYYRNFVYFPTEPAEQLTAPSWKSGEKWVVDGYVPYTLIEGFLTGRRETVRKAQGTKQDSVSIQNDTYDPLEWNPFRLLRMISFHELAGGPAYTGLANNALVHMDLSRVVNLEHGVTDHAVLFARVKSPATRVRIDGEVLAPAEHWTFVRAVLPVSQGGTVSRADEAR